MIKPSAKTLNRATAKKTRRYWPTSLHITAAARGKGRFMRAHGPIFAAMLAALVLAGCAGIQPCTTRTEIRRVPTPVFIQVPQQFVEPLEIQPLPQELNNRDLEADIRACEDVIDRCQSDRAEIRRRQEQRPQQEGDQ